MKQHRLGPNGAIMTSLNLFSTKFDQVSGKKLTERKNISFMTIRPLYLSIYNCLCTIFNLTK